MARGCYRGYEPEGSAPSEVQGKATGGGLGQSPAKIKKYTMSHVHSGSFSDEKHET
jgi:hypothetical protein